MDTQKIILQHVTKMKPFSQYKLPLWKESEIHQQLIKKNYFRNISS